MEITGKSRIMFVLADPVGHVRASAVMNAYFQSIGQNVAVSPLHVRTDDLGAVLAAIRCMGNVAGFGVTIPNKVAVLDHLDEVTASARRIGAVNFVKRTADGRLIGDNLDAPGFLSGLRKNGFDPKGRRAMQIGAGGAGRATAFALAEAGISELLIVNRDAAKARDLAAAVVDAFPYISVLVGRGHPAEFELIVNTTSLGMKADDPLPLDIQGIGAGHTVYDIIVNPPVTRLMAETAAQGAATIGGGVMLDEQMGLVARFIAP